MARTTPPASPWQGVEPPSPFKWTLLVPSASYLHLMSCAWSRQVKGNQNIQSTWSIRVQKRWLGGAWLAMPVSPTIPLVCIVSWCMSSSNRIILDHSGPVAFCHSLFLRASGLERGRHYKVCADMDGVGSLLMVDTLQEAKFGTQTWGSWSKNCGRNVPFRISVWNFWVSVIVIS